MGLRGKDEAGPMGLLLAAQWIGMAKKPKKKPTRGSGISVTLPTEPLAGAAKTADIMAILVQDEGVSLLEYNVREGQSIQVRVGGTVKAFMERVGDAPDGDGNVMFLEYDALSGPQRVPLAPAATC